MVALLAGFAAPVLMSASADMFVGSAADSIAEQLVDDAGSGLGVTITVDGSIADDEVAMLGDAISERMAAIPDFGPPVATAFTAAIGIGAPPAAPLIPVEVLPGSGARFMVREGAVDALDIVAHESDVDGLFVSEEFAERFDLSPGDEVGVEGSSTATVIEGVFRNLWEAPRDPYWDEVPAGLSPRFSRVFGSPLFEVIVVSDTVATRLGLVGTARFDLDLADRPSTEDDVDRIVAGLASVERSFTRDTEIGRAAERFAGIGSRGPGLESELFDLAAEMRARSDALDEPIITTALGGIALGVSVSIAGAGFVARRRSRELALLRADGDSRWRFALRSLGENVVPAAVGSVGGLAIALVVIRAFGPSGTATLADVDMSRAVICALVGLGGAAAATAFLAGRPFETQGDDSDRSLVTWLLPIAATATAAWVQVGRDDSTASVDIYVVIFPIVGLLAGVGIVVVAVRRMSRRWRRSGRNAPTPVFLAWRRLVASDRGSVGLTVIVGAAFGLVVFSTVLVDSIDAAAMAKARTAVGGPTRVRLTDDLDQVPERSTIVLEETTRLSVASRRVSVLAVAPDTWPDVVSWAGAFGSSPDDVIDRLAGPVDDIVPVLVVGDVSVPSDGRFGTDRTFDYRVVGTLSAAPLARTTPTIMVRSDVVESVALDRHLARRPADVTDEDWRADFVSPFVSYRKILVSTRPLDDVVGELDAQSLRYREETTISRELGMLDNRTVRWSFASFGILASIAAVAAIAGLLLYLREQQYRRELGDALARRMGLDRRGRLLASVVEVGTLVSIAFAAGTGVAVVLATHVFGRFEPSPAELPSTELRVPWALLAVVLAVGVVSVALVVVASHRRTQRRSLGEILREA